MEAPRVVVESSPGGREPALVVHVNGGIKRSKIDRHLHSNQPEPLSSLAPGFDDSMVLRLKRFPRMPHKRVLPNRQSTIVSGTKRQLLTKSYFQTPYPEFQIL